MYFEQKLGCKILCQPYTKNVVIGFYTPTLKIEQKNAVGIPFAKKVIQQSWYLSCIPSYKDRRIMFCG